MDETFCFDGAILQKITDAINEKISADKKFTIKIQTDIIDEDFYLELYLIETCLNTSLDTESFIDKIKVNRVVNFSVK